MPARAIPPPKRYEDLDDFLWRDFEHEVEWTTWLSQRGARPGRGSDFASALSLQAALRALEDVNSGGPSAPAAIKRLNALVAEYDVHPFVGDGGTSTLTAKGGLVGRMLIVALEAMADGTWKRFRRCRDATCHASFYDVSKSGTRAWCSMKRCGARAKMRRFRS